MKQTAGLWKILNVCIFKQNAVTVLHTGNPFYGQILFATTQMLPRVYLATCTAGKGHHFYAYENVDLIFEYCNQSEVELRLEPAI